MSELSREFLGFSIYNLSRYIFLKLESELEQYLEKFNITLPQLRILWIVKCFPKISANNISKIGCWSPPTVANMLKLLEEKKLILKEHNSNKKELNILLTHEGEKLINTASLQNKLNLSLLKLLVCLNYNNLDILISFYKEVSIQAEDNIIMDYIDKLNNYSLKFKLKSFNLAEQGKIKKITMLYNLIRVFVLSVEKEHSTYIKNMNVTYPQLRALKIIKSFPGLNSYDLSRLGFWSHSTANLISKNLFHKGLIAKEKSNNRNSIKLYITKFGENIITSDIKNNLNKISYINRLNNFEYSVLISVNSLLSQLIKFLGIEEIKEVVNKTYLIDSFD